MYDIIHLEQEQSGRQLGDYIYAPMKSGFGLTTIVAIVLVLGLDYQDMGVDLALYSKLVEVVGKHDRAFSIIDYTMTKSRLFLMTLIT